MIKILGKQLQSAAVESVSIEIERVFSVPSLGASLGCSKAASKQLQICSHLSLEAGFFVTTPLSSSIS
jgi:hypothetical protein